MPRPHIFWTTKITGVTFRKKTDMEDYGVYDGEAETSYGGAAASAARKRRLAKILKLWNEYVSAVQKRHHLRSSSKAKTVAKSSWACAKKALSSGSSIKAAVAKCSKSRSRSRSSRRKSRRSGSRRSGSRRSRRSGSRRSRRSGSRRSRRSGSRRSRRSSSRRSRRSSSRRRYAR